MKLQRRCAHFPNPFEFLGIHGDDESNMYLTVNLFAVAQLTVNLFVVAHITVDLFVVAHVTVDLFVVAQMIILQFKTARRTVGHKALIN